MAGTGFVTPYYNRFKYDGTITNFLCYPVTRALFGKDIRQPIGGDFALSIELVKDILDSSLWELPDVSRFGIDIFETLTALAKGYEVKQALLGVKNHDAKDPSSQLASMFRQVMNTMFTCIEQYELVWKEKRGVSKISIFGDAKYEDTCETIEVSLPATIEAFKSKYHQYIDIYNSILEQNIQDKFLELHLIESSNIDFPSEIWAKTVYSFIAEFHKTPTFFRERLIDALRVLWIGRVAAFLKETWKMSREECEEKIIEEAIIFEKLKPYLIEKYY